MTKHLNILTLPGDGIGSEILEQALRVFEAVKHKSHYKFSFSRGLIGGAAYDTHGMHFPEETKAACQNADVILFGAVGGPVSEQQNAKWKNCETNSILALRKLLDLYANIRPIKIDQELISLSPLRLEKFAPKVPDFLIIRELSGDLYFGEKKRILEPEETAFDQCSYSKSQIKRISEFAFKIAHTRRKKLHSVDKANVLETSKLWRETVNEIAKGYQDIELESMLVDNCAMQIITRPTDFDVIVTSNMFGDILSDAAAVIPGSLGLLASASFGSSGKWLFEPPSGSAPDIAGKGIANPIGMIRCIALLFQMVTLETDIYDTIESAISKTLKNNCYTKDISPNKNNFCTTKEFTDCLLKNFQ